MNGVVWWRKERRVSAPGDFERETRPSVETSLHLEGEEEEIRLEGAQVQANLWGGAVRMAVVVRGDGRKRAQERRRNAAAAPR